jgi:hypothetical protein
MGDDRGKRMSLMRIIREWWCGKVGWKSKYMSWEKKDREG